MQTALLNEPRTYRYSTVRLVLLIALLVLSGTAPFIILGNVDSVYILISWMLIGLIMLISIYSLTRSTTISTDGISSRTIFGERSLNWNEIDSVSGRGNGIKLHGRDGDVVAPSPQLPGYPEVIEIIGAKRPDLFKPAEQSVMYRNWIGSLLFLAIGAVSVGAGIYLYLDPRETESPMPLIFLAVLAVAFVIAIFSSVLALKFEGTTLTVRYLLGRKTLKPDEVRSVVFGVTQTRNGKSYNVHIFTTRGRTITFSGIGPSLPIVYLVLKNWHQGR